MEINWLVVSVIGNIVFGLYGAALTTYNIVKSSKEKKRQLTVKMSGGWQTRGYEISDKFMLFIEVANPGQRDVTINIPSIGLPDGKNIFTPIPLTHVRFPYELKEGKSCSIWVEKEEIKSELIKHGYSGTVKLRAKVSDATGKVYKARKPWKLELKEK